MALVLKDRVKETSTTAGTGTITLNGAVAGFQSFSAVGNANTTYYAIVDPTTGDWEVGLGTYTASGTTLSRDTVLSSSNSGLLVSFVANPKDVFVTYPSEKSVYEDASNVVNATSFGAITATSAALNTGTVSTTPASNTDIANKQYVDTLVSSGITYHTPVKYEVPDTTGNLNATYNNGASGVGATLTNAGALVAFTPDGTVASSGDRIIVYNQTNQFENGVYTVTTVGSGSVAWVLTRATDADTYALKSPNGLGNGDAFFITSGATGAGETYVCNTAGVITFGTTAITFAQISDSTLYTAGTGLTLSGTQFSITNTAVTAATYGSASAVPVFAVNAQGQITGVTDTNIAINGSAVSGNISGSAGSVANALTLGTYLTGGTYNGSSAVTATVDATSANTASKVVARDASGNFSAGTITATLNGTATSTASATNLSGGAANQVVYQSAAGTTAFATAPSASNQVLNWNGSAFTWSAGTISGVPLGSNLNSLTAGTYLTGTAYNGSAAQTWAVDATSANTASKVVARDGSGNFSAGTITAALSGNATTTSQTNFSNLTIGGSQVLYAGNYNSYAPTLTGTGASGTWGINVSGNAATASNASLVNGITAVQFFNNMGNAHSTYTNFNSFGDFGFRYMQGSTNGPGTGATQYYGMTLGLGNEYSSSQYASQFYWNRTSTGGNPYVSVRFLEGGSWTSWAKIYAGYADSAGSAGSVDYANLTNKGGGTGTYTTSGDYRAPIFYDSNDTSYYVDPASTSVLSALNLNTAGTALFRYLPPGTGTVSINAPFYWNAATGAINIAMIDNDTGGVVIDNEGVTVYGAGDTGGVFRVIDEDVWQSNGNNVDAATCFYVNQGTTGGWGRGNWEFYGSARAPIFYDYNNTGYYVDPTSGSNLAGTITMNGGKLLVLSDSGSYGQIQINSSNTSTEASLLFGSGGSGQNSGGYTYGGVIGLGAYGNSKANLYFGAGYSGPSMFIPNSSAYVEAINSFRAPIFYDSNDTGYYADPNSTSISFRGRGQMLIGPNSAGRYTRFGGDGGATDEATVSASNGNLHIDCKSGYAMYLNYYTNNNVYSFGNLGLGSDSASYRLHVHGTGYATSDFRSPIFYDSDNTARYCDPASTSNFVGLTVSNTISGSVSGCTFTEDSADVSNITNRVTTGFYQNSGATTALGWPVNSGSWQHLITSTHSNDNNYYALQLGATFFDQGLFYRSTAGSGTTGWSRVALYDNNYTAPLYASILYDSNNTSTYLNPNGASVISSGGSYPMDFRSSQRYICRFWNQSVAGNGFWLANDANTLTVHADSVGDVATLSSSGNFTVTGNVTAYSDERLKTDWADLQIGFVEALAKIKSGTYTRTDTGARQAGIGAQSLQPLLPEVVLDEGPHLAVAYGNAAMVSAVELAKYVTALEQRIAQLEARL